MTRAEHAALALAAVAIVCMAWGYLRERRKRPL
jgi:hypothetical protein